jgi:hypothetical protein
VVEVDLDAAGGERARREARQKWPDPDRGGDADALKYVEREMHRAVP